MGKSKGIKIGQDREYRNTAQWMGVGDAGYRTIDSAQFSSQNNLVEPNEGKNNGAERTDNRVLTNNMA